MSLKTVKELMSLVKPPRTDRLKAGFVRLKPYEVMPEHTTGNNEEFIYIIEGNAVLEIDRRRKVVGLEAGDYYYIPKNTVHAVFNPLSDDLKYIYVLALH